MNSLVFTRLFPRLWWFELKSRKRASNVALMSSKARPRQTHMKAHGRSAKGYRYFEHYAGRTQAEKVIKAFGGVRALSRALNAAGTPKDPTCIYKWTYPYPRGTGGRIPAPAHYEIERAAQRLKINLPRDWKCCNE